MISYLISMGGYLYLAVLVAALVGLTGRRY